MDANTASVVIAIVTLVVSPVTLFLIQRANAKQIKAVSTQIHDVKTKVEDQDKTLKVVDGKVDDYHKEVNGKMGLLLQTTKDLATAQEKARGEAADAAKPENKKNV